ncbi:MAG: hypothetical protein JSU63_20470 [Phycisphaerales bacterium]|nr:MAG: hypothetical protein JSU63_20470 [Phycisphaerales bacterium]
MLRFVVLIYLVQSVISGAVNAQTVLYVDTHAPGSIQDGSSWTQAFTDLQSALALAAAGATLHVADGTYVPDPGGLANPRLATFRVIDGVSIYGGFAGFGAPEPDKRNILINKTILSGDLQGDDVADDFPDGTSVANNVYHVVTANGTSVATLLDGLTITAGKADAGQDDDDCGGGLLNVGGNLRVVDCVFSHNSAASCGGGMYTSAGSPVLTGCLFRSNSASRGGAVHNNHESPTFSRCSFLANIATGAGGGGVYNSGGGPEFSDCFFLDNVAAATSLLEGGGAIRSSFGSTTLENCVLRGNSGGAGGALFSESFSRLTVANCLFSQNLGLLVGGAIYCRQNVTLGVSTSTFADNAASDGRSLAFDSQDQKYPSTADLTDCILWDGENGIWDNDGSMVTIAFSDIRGGWPDGKNIDDDPLFVAGPNGDYYLAHSSAGQLYDSPCFDVGSGMADNLGFGQMTTRSDEHTDTGTIDMGYHYPITGQAFTPGDFDRDGAVTLSDYAQFQRCFTGEADLNALPACRAFDMEPDGSVTLIDFSTFQRSLIGR